MENAPQLEHSTVSILINFYQLCKVTAFENNTLIFLGGLMISVPPTVVYFKSSMRIDKLYKCL